MNKSQQSYLKDRISTILNDKLTEAQKKYGTKKLTNLEKYNLVKGGKVRALPFAQHYSYGNLTDFKFDFSQYEKDYSTVPAYIKFEADIRKKAQDITDEIILGDCTVAAELIKKFEAIKV